MIDTEFFSLSLNVIYSLHNGEIFTQSLIICASQDQHDNYDKKYKVINTNTALLFHVSGSYCQGCSHCFYWGGGGEMGKQILNVSFVAASFDFQRKTLTIEE